LSDDAGTSRGKRVAVIGLGRFGTAVAESLMSLGHEVLAIDSNPVLVQKWAERLSHVVEADSADPVALKALGIDEMRYVVVAIGSDIEASVLTVLALSEMNVPDIWAKAVNANHGRILQRTGAHHVVFPEAAMGERVAHLVVGKMVDFIEFDDDFAIAKVRAPWSLVGRKLGSADTAAKFGVTIMGVKRAHADFMPSAPETVIDKDDLLVVSGKTRLVEKFASQAR
jgi:trk system potassium uptake protein TrkA